MAASATIDVAAGKIDKGIKGGERAADILG
jgi:hypothetical protein